MVVRHGVHVRGADQAHGFAAGFTGVAARFFSRFGGRRRRAHCRAWMSRTAGVTAD